MALLGDTAAWLHDVSATLHYLDAPVSQLWSVCWGGIIQRFKGYLCWIATETAKFVLNPAIIRTTINNERLDVVSLIRPYFLPNKHAPPTGNVEDIAYGLGLHTTPVDLKVDYRVANVSVDLLGETIHMIQVGPLSILPFWIHGKPSQYP